MDLWRSCSAAWRSCSCLGLFGLSSFLGERRSKEMNIRKVLGASGARIWLLLSGDFLSPVFIAFLLAVPLSMLIAQKILSGITYHARIGWWMFVAAGSLAVVIALLTVSYQGLKVASDNPVKRLRTE